VAAGRRGAAPADAAGRLTIGGGLARRGGRARLAAAAAVDVGLVAVEQAVVAVVGHLRRRAAAGGARRGVGGEAERERVPVAIERPRLPTPVGEELHVRRQDVLQDRVGGELVARDGTVAVGVVILDEERVIVRRGEHHLLEAGIGGVDESAVNAA